MKTRTINDENKSAVSGLSVVHSNVTKQGSITAQNTGTAKTRSLQKNKRCSLQKRTTGWSFPSPVPLMRFTGSRPAGRAGRSALCPAQPLVPPRRERHTTNRSAAGASGDPENNPPGDIASAPDAGGGGTPRQNTRAP